MFPGPYRAERHAPDVDLSGFEKPDEFGKLVYPHARQQREWRPLLVPTRLHSSGRAAADGDDDGICSVYAYAAVYFYA